MANEIATRSKNEVAIFLEERMTEIATACSKYVKPESVVQVVNVCTYKTPKLLQCDKTSILHSVIQAVSLGFSLNPSAGEAYLIPRWNKALKVLECQFQPGYQGLTKLARESGRVNLVKAELVRDGDAFRVTYNPEMELFHEPKSGNTFDTPITHVYAWAKLSTGERLIEVMDISEVEYIRSRAESPGEGPWETAYGEMVKKTAIRRLCKSLPKTPQMEQAIAAHDAGFDLEVAQLEGNKRIAISNGTSHGSGKYASPAETAVWLKAMEGYLDQRNCKWFDRWTGQDIEPSEIKELCNRWQADNHLVKWAIAVKLLNPASVPESGQKNREIGRFTAIIYHGEKKDRNALVKELARYIDDQERMALEGLARKHPELFDEAGEDEPVADDEFEPGEPKDA